MARAKSDYFKPKYSKKIQDFIVDKIEGGMTLAEVCREYGPPQPHAIVPNEKTCYNWKKKFKEFRIAVDEAYQTLIFKFLDELNDLSKQTMKLAHELKEASTMKEARFESIRLKGQIEANKTRIKTLEFMLNRIAPKLVPALGDTQHNTTLLPPITIINYSDQQKSLSGNGNGMELLPYETIK